ncbi:unnamed protein product [Lampetra fluviatilis]
MSKSGVRWKTMPAVHLDNEDASEEELATIPEAGAPEMCPAEADGLELEETAVGGAAKLELLQLTMAQLAVALAEVGDCVQSAGRNRGVANIASPTKMDLAANSPADAPRHSHFL